MINLGQKTCPSNIGLNKVLLLVKINSLSNPNDNHYELLCRKEYKLLSLKSVGTLLSNNIDNYDSYRLIKNILTKISKMSKPEYGIYVFLNTNVQFENIKIIDYIKSIDDGKFYKNNFNNLISKNYGNINDIFMNFNSTDVTSEVTSIS